MYQVTLTQFTSHIEYFNNAKKLADFLFVIVNNDKQRLLRGSKEFQLEDERMFSLKY